MIRIIMGVLLLVLYFATSCFAQAKISEEKKALIKELLAVTHALQNAEAVINLVGDQMEKETAQSLQSIIDDKGRSLSPAQKDQLKKEVIDSSKRASQRARELFKQRINFAQVMEEVTDEVYDAHYSTEELKDLLAFYESPTGQKTIRITPQILSESMLKTAQRLTPEIEAIAKQVVDEEMAVLRKHVPSRSSAGKKP